MEERLLDAPAHHVKQEPMLLLATVEGVAQDLLQHLKAATGGGKVVVAGSYRRRKETERIIRAMDNRYCDIIDHPTARLRNKRGPFEIDLERIMRAALVRGCCLELNAQPDRLDLNDAHCRMAKELGLKVAISTTAHSCSQSRPDALRQLPSPLGAHTPMGETDVQSEGQLGPLPLHHGRHQGFHLELL